MSATIDERVVSMRFDNQQFERNVSTTMSTLDKLKQKLHLDGAAKGLEDVNTAAGKVNFSGITSGIEAVQVKFSYLQASIQHQLNKIVDSTIAAGKKMASALTIDPIKSGFQEYETQINAVQTILANTSHAGTDLDDVNRVLDDLNTYADKTIYNFTEMTRNIGTFTAAGLGLEESASAIKGIANLAAVSGSTSQQASTAMYQLSQALANGTVNLQDWNSVVNAGMGGKVFQDALVRTASAMQGVTEETFRANNITGSFRESISAKDGTSWLTAEVLSKTLQQFTGDMTDAELAAMGFTDTQIKNIQAMAVTANDAATKVKTFTQLWDTLKEAAQSGWTQSWELLVGDFEEAKEFLTEISDTIGGMIGKSADARNELLSGGLRSGWDQLLGKGISNEADYIDTIKSVAKEHGVAIDEMIGKSGSFEETLNDGWVSSEILSESIHKYGDKLRGMSDAELEAAGYTQKHIEEIEALESAIDDGTISMTEFADKISKPSGRENLIQSLRNAFNGLMSVVTPVKEAFREIFPPMTANQLYALTEGLKKFTAKLILSEEASDKLKRTFKGVFAIIDIIAEAIKAVVGGAIDLIGNFAGIEDGILGATASIGDFISNFRDSIKNTDLFGTAVSKVTGFLSNMITKLKEFGKSLKVSFETPGYEGFVGFLKFAWDLIKSIGSGVVELFSSIGNGLAKALGSSDFFDAVNSGLFAGILASILYFSNGLSKPLDAISDMFESISGKDGILENVTGILDDVRGCFQAYQNQLKAGTLLKIAGAIAILAASIFVISRIDDNSLEKAIGAITVLFAELLGSLAIFTNISTNMKGVTKSCLAMISMSIAVGILAGALKKISSIDPVGIVKGLVAIGVLMAELSAFLKFAKIDGKMTGTAVGIVILSAAMLILAKAVKNFGNMSWEEIGKGLAAIGGLLAELAAFSKLTGNAKRVLSTGIAMVALGAAMKIFASAIKDFASMSWDEIGKGLSTMGGALAEITIATNLMPKNMFSIGVGLLIIGGAMKVLADALSYFGGMSWTEIAKGLAAMGGALVELTIALNLMKGTLAGSAALLVAAGALAIIAPVMTTLGKMSWTEIAKSLITLAGAFVVVGVAGAVLGPLLPSILGLAGAFALFGVATLGIGAGLTLIGVGLTTIATGFTALAAAGAAGATAVVASISIIVTGILDLIPTIIESLGDAITSLCVVVGECAPQIAECVLKLITEVLNSCATYAPQIVDALMLFLIGILDSLAEHLPTLIASAMNVIGAFFQGVVDALNGIDTTNLLKGVVGLGLLTGLMVLLSTVAGLIPGAMVGVVGMGAVIAELALVLAAVGALAQIPGLSWLIGEGGDFLQTLGTAIGQFIGGIAGGFMTGISSSFPQIGDDLSAFMLNIQPFIDGAKNIDEAAMSGVKALAETILILTAANILDGITSWITGGSSLSDFAKELVPFGEALKNFSMTVSGNIDEGAVTAAANAGKIMAEMASTLPNSGGVVGWFSGENDMSAFGAEMLSFGEAVRDFSATVSGNIDEGAVTAAANAGKMMAEMATTLPNSGGVVSWFTGDNNMSTFGEQLVPFGKAISEFSSIISGNIDEAAVTAAANAGKTMSEMASTLPNSGGVVSWFTGDNDMSTFGTQLVSFGKAMTEFSETVSGNIDPLAVTTAAIAGKIMSEMASTLPNSGGVVSWFTADNDMSTFGKELVSFGKAISNFSSTVSGNINEESVTAAANAGKIMAEMATTLPTSGGVVSWFTADNDMSTFAKELVPFGRAIKAFSDIVAGNIDEGAVTAAATAGKTMAEMANTLPTSGGVVSWFTADNDMSTFGAQLVPFGTAIRDFSTIVSGGIDESAVTAAANAGKIMAAMVPTLPTSGGVVSWFTGDKDMASFGAQLVPFGTAIRDFSTIVSGGIDESAVTAAANAGKIMAEMANTLPTSGGVVSWFTGDKDMASFGAQLVPFGKAITDFSATISGNIDETAVLAAATAGKTMAEMANTLPTSGGVVSWFTADNDMSTFGTQLVSFGKAVRDFSASVSGGIDEGAVIAAANAGKIMAEMATTLPTSGGVMSWFTADNDMSTFGSQLIPFGRAIKTFSDTVSGGIDEGAVAAAANAGKMMAEMATTLPTTGGLVSWFTGDNDLASFGKKLVPFGTAMKEYSNSVIGLKSEAVVASATAAQSIASLASNLPTTGGLASWFTGDNDLASFAKKLIPFGTAIKEYSLSVVGVNSGSVSSSITAAKNIVNFINTLSDFDGSGVDSFKKALESLGKVSIDSFVKNFSDSTTKVQNVGADMIDSLVKGIKSKQSTVTTNTLVLIDNMVKCIDSKKAMFNSAGVTIVTQLASGITKSSIRVSGAMTSTLSSAIISICEYYTNFYNAGSYLVSGFVNGISMNTFKAEAEAAAMAAAAYEAAKEELDINSPSKIFRKLGYAVPEGFAMGIDRLSDMVEGSSVSMANVAIDGVKNSISRIADVINADMDTQPTIRPVVDLSNVKAGVNDISGMFDTYTSMGLSANVRSISSMMNTRGQNGGNDDVVSAIDKLRDKLGNIGTTIYNVDGVTYDDGSNISNAVETLVRAARVERRI